MTRIEHKENPFPADKEERLNAILNVVNTELKTVAFLHLDDKFVSGAELKSRVRRTIGAGVYLPYSSNSFGQYCGCSFYPVGCVAEERVLEETNNSIKTGYSLTDAGRTYGLPIAVFTLDYVTNNNHSLFPILGSTSTPKGLARSPASRAGVLRELVKGDLRIADLKQLLKISDVALGKGLRNLAKLDLVSLKTVGFDEEKVGRVYYEWTGNKKVEDIKYCRAGGILTREVAQLLEARKKLSAPEAYEIFREEGRLSRKYISPFTEILSYLAEEGAAVRAEWGGDKSDGKYSEAKITDKGRAFLADYIEKVESALMDGPELAMMQTRHEQIMNNPEELKKRMITAINLYREVSGHINYVSHEKRESEIVGFIRANPGARYFELLREFPWSNVSKFLKPLMGSGFLRLEKTGRQSRYFAVEG